MLIRIFTLLFCGALVFFPAINTHAFIECRLVTTVEEGDHSIFVGEVVKAGVTQEPEGRADDATLLLKNLG